MYDKSYACKSCMAYFLQMGIAFIWHNGIFVIDLFLLNGIVLIGIVLYNYKLQEPGVSIGVSLCLPFLFVFLLIKQIL